MRKLVIKLIHIYQNIPTNMHSSCRHIPTCSNYAIIAIERFGTVKGIVLSIKRILKCNPLFKGGIDLVPEKKEKR